MGLAMSRSLGDDIAHQAGVSSEPEVMEHDIDASDQVRQRGEKAEEDVDSEGGSGQSRRLPSNSSSDMNFYYARRSFPCRRRKTYNLAYVANGIQPYNLLMVFVLFVFSLYFSNTKLLLHTSLHPTCCLC